MIPPRLGAARVLLVGAGGIGSPAALHLAGAGLGALGLVDDDLVEPANLHRQILHRTADAGRAKVDSAAAALRRRAPGLETITHRTRLDATNALDLVRDYDVVLDGSDNFATRFLVNDTCVRARRPYVHAAAIRWGGQLLAVAPGGPCYRCLFEEPPAAAAGFSCAEAGVVGPLVGVVGGLAAEAVLRLLSGAVASDEGRLLIYDGLAGTHREVRFRRNPRCGACGDPSWRGIQPRIHEVAAC